MIRNQMKDSEINFYKFGTILITGCAGSLGYELVSFLRRHGGTKRIIGIDNCCMGYPLWLKKAISKKEIDFYQEDVSKINLTDIPGAGEVTHVFHMASIASPVLYRKDPIGTMDANVAACRNLLDYYKNSKLKVFCLFSSSEIYGSPEGKDIPTKESYWNVHFHEIGTGNGQELDIRLTGHSPGKQCLTGTGRAYQQHAVGDPGTDIGEFLGISQELHHLLQFFLLFVSSRHIGEGDLLSIRHAQHSAGLAEILQGVIVIGPAHEHGPDKQQHQACQHQRQDQLIR